MGAGHRGSGTRDRKEGLSAGAVGYVLFALVFGSLLGLALLVSEQVRRERGLDDTDPHVTRGGFGRGRRRRPITRGELALGLLGIGATLALLALELLGVLR
jgi:hypothetical protein